MSKYKKLFECVRPEFISELKTTRTEDQGVLKVSLQTYNHHIELFGFEDLADSVSSMLCAEIIVISEELNTGKEFGTIRIECWVDESYLEYWCDRASVK